MGCTQAAALRYRKLAVGWFDVLVTQHLLPSNINAKFYFRQYVLYRQILNEMSIERILYLAVSRPTFNSVLTIELGQVLLKNQIIRLIVFDDEREAMLLRSRYANAQWIPD